MGDLISLFTGLNLSPLITLLLVGLAFVLKNIYDGDFARDKA
jgi:hypothetical protein